MKYATFNTRKTWMTLFVLVLLCGILLLAGCNRERPLATAPEGTTATTEATEGTEGTVPVETSDVTPEATEPEETIPAATEPTVTDTTEKPSETPEETLLTYYTTKKVNYRTGPGTDYKKAGSLDKGAAVQVVQGSKTGKGWYKIKIDEKSYYAYAEYLSKTKPAADSGVTGDTAQNSKPSTTPSTSTPSTPSTPSTGNTSSGNTSSGNTSSGSNSSNSGSSTSSGNSSGSSKPSTGNQIIYTYPDGTTGTTPKNGATYEMKPGVIVTYREPVSSSTPEEVENAKNGISYCKHCEKLRGDGSSGTCRRWLIAGDHTCKLCKETVPANVCHTCKED